MPIGIYKRTKKHKKIAQLNLIKRYKKGEKVGFQKGHDISNTGRTHFKKGMKAWNKGKPAPWVKGFKKGCVPWNKGKHPKCYQKENHPNWKGGITNIEVRAGKPKPKRCEICDRIGKICFDHDHKTGKFRGWICWGCNVALGHVEDNKNILKKMVKYLEIHG